jgi:hypothetical protein
VLYDDDELTAPGSSEELSATTTFYADDVDTDSGVFNVIRVEPRIRVPSTHLMELDETPREPSRIIPMFKPVVQAVTSLPD